MGILYDFINLVFPKVCPACGELLVRNERVICYRCLYHLPRTDFHLKEDNPVAQMFWGRVLLEHAASYCLFQKGSRIRRLIHALKYGGNQEIGEELGRQFGYELKPTVFSNAELVIPGPLSKRKKRKRGFNQSECIARGLAQALEKPLNTTALIRSRHTRTQTSRSRYERWLNVEHSFVVANPGEIAQKHILLVDDVVTTGATIEACASELLAVPGTKVSAVTLAVTLKYTSY